MGISPPGTNFNFHLNMHTYSKVYIFLLISRADYSTPTLDKLATEGIQLSSTMSNCVFSALLAGKYAYNLDPADGVITNGHHYEFGHVGMKPLLPSI